MIYLHIFDSVLALELRQNRAQYEARARQLTKDFAMKQSREELRKVNNLTDIDVLNNQI